MVSRERVVKVLKAVELYGRQHPYMWNVSWENGLLLKTLVLAKRAERVLEVGTSDGFSTIWLAWAASIVGGRVITVEMDAERVAMASRNLAEADLADYVEQVIGNAKIELPGLQGEFDFVFLDAAKSEYLSYFDVVRGKLARGALVVADDAITERESMLGYLNAVENDPELESALISIDDGIEITYVR
ncbi:MAG: O-methyltransferase [Thermoprotei archaeon]